MLYDDDGDVFWGPFYKHRLTLIPARVSDNIYHNVL